MEVLIIDIETSGLHKDYHSIVEIGLILLDTDTGEMSAMFDSVMHDDNWNPNSPTQWNAWIFQNSSLTPEKVDASNHLETYRDELQGYFDQWPLTAFNKSFDLRFLRARGFVIDDTKCISTACHSYTNATNKLGQKKRPSVQEAYDEFFPNENFVEDHRGYSDALHEAQLLYKVVELKKGIESNGPTTLFLENA